MRFKIFPIFLLFSLTASAQEIPKTNSTHFPSAVSNWVKQPLPLSNEAMNAVCKNNSATELYEENGELMVRVKTFRKNLGAEVPFSLEPFKSQIKSYDGTRYTLEVEDGFLVGFKDELWWFDKKGGNAYRISRQTAYAIVVLNEEVYAIHSQGLLNIIHTIDGQWIVGEDSRLRPEEGNEVECYMQLGDTLFLVSGRDLLMFKKISDDYYAVHFDHILQFSFEWGDCYPTFMTLHNGSIYIATRGGIIQLSNIMQQLSDEDNRNYRFGNWDIKWLQPK